MSQPVEDTPRRFWTNAAGYAAAVALSLCILVCAMRLWRADLDVPFSYLGDAFFTQMQVRGLLDNGWYLTHPRAGFPGTSELHDFPVAESLHMVLLKGIGTFAGNAVRTINLFFLLTFPLTALTSYGVLRQLGIGRATALVIAQLYTFLPHHLYRSTYHLFLSAYFHVPLMILVVLWVYLDTDFLVLRRATGFRFKLRLFRAKSLAAVVICLLAAAGGVYYAFFGCFFLTVAGLTAWAARRDFRPVLAAGLLAGTVVATALAGLTPSLLYTWKHGVNELTKRQFYVSAEIYGLKLAQLLLPLPGHAVPALAQTRERYDQGQQVLKQEANESQTTTLGLAGSVGLVLLLAGLFHRRSLTGRPDLEEGLSKLAGAGVLLGTVGGFGTLFALLVFPSIRAYNRIAIYLAFFGLIVVALLLDRVARRWGETAWGRRGAFAGLALLLALALCDQSAKHLVPNYVKLKAIQTADAAFIRDIEAALPPGAAVFQLPHMPFPEVDPPGKMIDYDHLRGYLYSQKLRWSYGSMKGRATNAWQTEVTARPTETMLPELVTAGFDGILLDRLGYDDKGAKIEAELRHLLGQETLYTPDGRFLFFNLADYKKQLEKNYSPDEWRRRRLALTVLWREAFSVEEYGDGGARWRWCCGRRGEVRVANFSPQPRTVVVRLRLGLVGGKPCRLRVSGPLWEEGFTVDCQPSDFVERTLIVPPGEHTITFTCDNRAVRPEGDARYIVFRVLDFTLREPEEPANQTASAK